MTFGLNFPVSDYYRDHIRDGLTLSRGGGWWTAAVLIEDPRSGRLFISCYTWQKLDDQWKTRKSFAIRSRNALDKLIEAATNFREKLT